jgi:hypothetical protein
MSYLGGSHLKYHFARRSQWWGLGTRIIFWITLACAARALAK